MKFIVLFVAVLMYGCAVKTPAPNPDALIKVAMEEVSVSLNNLKAKSDEVVARFPDEFGVQTIFVEEINRALAKLQAKKGVPTANDIDRLAVAVTYNRHFAQVSGGIGLPNGSFSVVAFDQAGEQIWKAGREDIVVQGTVFLNIIDIYKVPVGLFRQGEERKYLGIWAEAIAKIIYNQSQAHVDRPQSASTEPVAPLADG